MEPIRIMSQNALANSVYVSCAGLPSRL